MADKTGMSIEAVQRLTFVAEQSGNTLEQVSGAVSMLQKRLAEGDDSAVGALRQLGIEHERFMAMSPDQQFLEVARAVKDIEDPMQRAKVATELFGRAGTELLPTLIANVDELARQAPVMSERATKAFDSIGDSISRLTSKLKVMVGEGLASAMDAYGRLAQGAGQVLSGQFAKAAETLLDLGDGAPARRHPGEGPRGCHDQRRRVDERGRRHREGSDGHLQGQPGEHGRRRIRSQARGGCVGEAHRRPLRAREGRRRGHARGLEVWARAR